MIIGEVSTDGEHLEPQRSDEQRRRTRSGKRLEGLMEVECIGWEKTAGTSMELATIAINMATLGANCPKMSELAKKGVNCKGAPKGGGKDQGGKLGGNGGGRTGTTHRSCGTANVIN